MEHLPSVLKWIWDILVHEALHHPVPVALLLLGLLSRFGVLIQTGSAGVLFVFGRARRELGPGFFWMVPFVWTVRKVPVRSVTFSPPPQVVTTADGLVYEVQANLVYRIVDPIRSVVQIADLRAGLTALVPMVVQGVMQRQTRASLAERDLLEKAFAVRVEERLVRWGVQIEQAGFTTIAPTKKTLRVTQLALRVAERERAVELFLDAGLAPEIALNLLGADRRLVGHSARRYQRGVRRRHALKRETIKRLADARTKRVRQQDLGLVHVEGANDVSYHEDADRALAARAPGAPARGGDRKGPLSDL